MLYYGLLNEEQKMLVPEMSAWLVTRGADIKEGLIGEGS
ncbi:hypothetical protein ES703_54382 [subsurface metagenome]